MGVEEEVVVRGRKGKKSKREERNEEGVKEIRHSGNVVVEGDERIFEKEDVMEKNKGDMKKKMKKKKVDIDTKDGDIVGKKGIQDGAILSRGGDGEAAEDVDRKKKKKKEKGKRKEGLGVGSDLFVENEGDARLINNEKRDSDGKYGKKGEVFGEGGVAEKVDKKKKKKREKKRDKGDVSAAQQDSTAWKATYSGEGNGKGVEIFGEGRDGKIMEKVEKKKKKNEKGQSKNDLKGVEITGQGLDGEVMEKGERKKRKREKGQIKDDLKGVEITGEGRDGEVMEKVERKKRKREKGKSMDDLGAGEQDITTNSLASAEGNSCSTGSEIQDGDMKKNRKGKRKKTILEGNGSENPKAKKGKKKVSFSGQVEVFPLSADSSSQESKDGDDKLVRGKRFSPEEDEIVKEAVYNYIEEHALGEEGLNMILNCRSHPEIKDCWKHIAKAIPYRPQTAIYYRAQVLFRRGDKRKWTEEDYELIRKFQEEHGNQWKTLAEEFGKHRFHVKDTWRRIKLLHRKKGQWSQEEYQTLFDLVNTDLQLKLSEEKKTKHGMLRDNIHWSAISDRLSTRSDATCCLKWYNQLTSPMVAEGLWADADDYRLINALFSLDASCIEDVDWDNLLDHRSGDVCRKRWNQMVLHIGQHGSKSFAEQVEILARRYCPDILEVREAWDSKPVVA